MFSAKDFFLWMTELTPYRDIPCFCVRLPPLGMAHKNPLETGTISM